MLEQYKSFMSIEGVQTNHPFTCDRSTSKSDRSGADRLEGTKGPPQDPIRPRAIRPTTAETPKSSFSGRCFIIARGHLPASNVHPAISSTKRTMDGAARCVAKTVCKGPSTPAQPSISFHCATISCRLMYQQRAARCCRREREVSLRLKSLRCDFDEQAAQDTLGADKSLSSAMQHRPPFHNAVCFTPKVATSYVKKVAPPLTVPFSHSSSRLARAFQPPVARVVSSPRPSTTVYPSTEASYMLRVERVRSATAANIQSNLIPCRTKTISSEPLATLPLFIPKPPDVTNHMKSVSIVVDDVPDVKKYSTEEAFRETTPPTDRRGTPSRDSSHSSSLLQQQPQESEDGPVETGDDSSRTSEESWHPIMPGPPM